MDVDQKNLLELAKQLGLEGKDSSSINKATHIAEAYKNKSEEDLLKEILELKRNIKSNPTQFKKQMEAVKILRSMMNQEQRDRLDQIIALLEKD
jgi:hypothetical protein